MNEAMTAGMPTVKKNGMIGMKPPTAVDSVAEIVDRSGLGKLSSDEAKFLVHERREELLRFGLQPFDHRAALLQARSL